MPVVPWDEPPPRQSFPPNQLPHFNRSLTFERLNVQEPLNVQCKLKRNKRPLRKVVNFLGEKVHRPPEKILATRTKKKTSALRWYGAPEWLIQPCAPAYELDNPATSADPRRTDSPNFSEIEQPAAELLRFK